MIGFRQSLRMSNADDGLQVKALVFPLDAGSSRMVSRDENENRRSPERNPPATKDLRWDIRAQLATSMQPRVQPFRPSRRRLELKQVQIHPLAIRKDFNLRDRVNLP